MGGDWGHNVTNMNCIRGSCGAWAIYYSVDIDTCMPMLQEAPETEEEMIRYCKEVSVYFWTSGWCGLNECVHCNL